MDKQVKEGSLVELELILKQGKSSYPMIETELICGSQYILPPLNAAIKNKKEGDRFKISLSPKELRSWEKAGIGGIDFSQTLTVEVFIKKVKQPSADELLAIIRQSSSSCKGGACGI